MPEKLSDSPIQTALRRETPCVVFVRTSSTARIPVYQQLKDQGYSMVMMHPGESSEFSHLFEHWIDCETNNADILETELRCAAKDKAFFPTAILSFDEYGVYPASQLAQRFAFRPLPLGPEGLRNTTVKSAFRDWCVKHDIGSPKFAKLMTKEDDVEAAMKDITFPCVVKPSPGAGSMLTQRINSMDELVEALPSMWAALSSHPALIHLEALGTKVHLLVEEFIGGQEVDVDCVVENGVVRFCGISDNFETKPPYFCEQGGLAPSALGTQEQRAIRDLLDAFVVSHGTELHGVLHFEAKYDHNRDRAYVIEVNCRPGSAETHTMVSSVYGVHLGACLARLACRSSLDDLNLEEVQARGYCASVNVYPEKEGVLKAIHVDESDPDLVHFSSLSEGSTVAPPPVSFGLMAWMVTKGSTPEGAIRSIGRLTSSLEVQLSSSDLHCDADGHFDCDCMENASLALSFATVGRKSLNVSFAGLASRNRTPKPEGTASRGGSRRELVLPPELVAPRSF